MSEPFALHGTANTRDLGGLRTADGRQVKPRQVLRSDSLTELDADDLTALVDGLGLAQIIDLRAEREAARDGRGPLAERSVPYINLPLGGISEARLKATVELGEGDLALHYVGYLENGAANIVAAVRLLAEGALPVVVHCSAGKDRTGIVVAMVLDALGVSHETIIADYAATAQNMPGVIERLRRSPSVQGRVGPDRAATMIPAWVLGAEPQTMRRFLRYLGENGGAAQWMLQHGLSTADLDRLRSNLLD